MKEKWTGSLIGKMHNADVTYEDLAKEMGVTKAYVSMILNCSRTPPNAEERLNDAFNSILKRKKNQSVGEI